VSPADLAWPATGAGVIVLAWGLVQAALAPREAAATFARAVILALEFLLAAGLLRLGAAMTATELAAVVGVIATRRVVSLGLGRLSRGAGRPARGRTP